MQIVKFYNLLIIFSVAFVDCYATVLSRNYNDLGYKKCIDQETGREYYVGEAFYKPGKCIRIQCLGNLQLWEDGCSVPELDGNCTEISGDINFLYPKCCPKYKCHRVLNHGNFEEVRVYNHYGNLLSNNITQLFVFKQT